MQGFPWEVDLGGEIFNNRLLFKNNRLLFSYCLLEIFMGDMVLMEGDKVTMGDHPVPPL